jgi:hypothetical protein
MRWNFRKGLLFFLTILFVLHISKSVKAQEYQGFYLGLHWEKNGTVNNRIGVYNSEKGYFIADIGWPILLAELGEWNDDSATVQVNGEQIRMLSLRGGAKIIALNKGYISIDVCGEYLRMRAQLDSIDLTLKKTYCYPFSIGPSWAQSIGERFHIVTILNWGVAFSERRKGDEQMFHQRLGVDMYLHYWIAPNFMLYGNIGYGYFPRGLPKTYPLNKSIGASLIAVGFAF